MVLNVQITMTNDKRWPCLIYDCYFFQYILKRKHVYKVSKGAKIRNRYNQVPHLTQDTNWKVTDSQ